MVCGRNGAGCPRSDRRGNVAVDRVWRRGSLGATDRPDLLRLRRLWCTLCSTYPCSRTHTAAGCGRHRRASAGRRGDAGNRVSRHLVVHDVWTHGVATSRQSVHAHSRRLSRRPTRGASLAPLEAHAVGIRTSVRCGCCSGYERHRLFGAVQPSVLPDHRGHRSPCGAASTLATHSRPRGARIRGPQPSGHRRCQRRSHRSSRGSRSSRWDAARGKSGAHAGQV